VKYYQVLIILLFFISLNGCQKKSDKETDPVIAQVMKKTLTLSELRASRPIPNDKKDSEEVAKVYIDNWIKQQLLVSEAESKLSQKELNIEREIESYRQELIIQKYKNKIMQNIINKEVSDSDADKYYRENSNEFKLPSPIVKVKYIIFPAGLSVPESILEILNSSKPYDIEKYEDYIFRFAKKYDDFDNNWIYLENLLNSLNYFVPMIDDFVKNEKIITKKVNNELHIIAINSFHLSGEKAPFDFVTSNIKGTITNNRKAIYLRELKDSLYKDALKYKKFRVYN